MPGTISRVRRAFVQRIPCARPRRDHLRFRARRGPFAAVLLCALAGSACRGGNPDALWNIVHQQCVPDQRQHGNPSPCALVELDRGEEQGYAVLKDRNGPYQYLLIPTARIAGMESPGLASPGLPNYFAAAWQARSLVEKAAHRTIPREMLSLAINSQYGRSQDQFHIHIDCVRPEVGEALHAHLREIGDRWELLKVPLGGHYYRAMRIGEARFERDNPLQLLAASPGGGEMGRHTLVVVGASFEDGTPGFILLDDWADLWRLDRGHGEELQSHSCS